MTPTETVFLIPGRPRGQGSMTLIGKGARYPATTIDHRNLAITVMVQGWAGRPPLEGPIQLAAVLTIPRPKAHRDKDGALKPDAPKYHTTGSDLDKMIRLLGDATTIAGIIHDDSQISIINAIKVWGDTGSTTVTINQIQDHQ